MIYRWFSNTYQSQILLIIIAGALLWLPGFLEYPTPPAPPEVSPFYGWYDNMAGSLYLTIAGFILLMIQGAVLTATTGSYRILGMTNLSPFLFYLLFMSYNSNFLTLNPSLFSGLLGILIIRQLIANYGKKQPLLEWFNTSLLAGIAILIHPGNLYLLVLIWITLVIYQSYTFREWFISLTGLIAVLLFYGMYLFWIDDLPGSWQAFTSYYSQLPTSWPQSLPYAYLPFLAVFALLVLFTVPRMIFKLDENIIRTRKRLNVVIFHAVLLLIAIAVDPKAWSFYLFQLFIPLSFTVSRLVNNIRKE
ncbi:MAG: hypothetical protein ACQESX_06785, partial [Bacteroidota bacterium]